MDARIGALNGGQFYCFPHGYAAAEFRGSLAEVEASLGLRPRRVVEASPARRAAKRQIRLYEVTVTPSMVAYAGSSTFGEYKVAIAARDRVEAISKARAERRDADGRLAVPAKFSARLAEGERGWR